MSAPTIVSLLCDAYDAIEHVESAEELRLQMDRFAKEMGFEHFVYALTIDVASLKRQQYTISGFPQEWVERYISRGYFKTDPLVRYAEKSTLPAVWNDQIFHDSRSAEFWHEAYSFGLRAGLTFAVHDRPGVTGIFSLARDKALDMRGADLAALIGRAQLFASLLHQAVVRIDLPKLLPQQTVSLTARERECLQWAADGKTAWEIGQILSIAERTVVFHINNVVQKLGAVNKTHAIVRAVALGLV